MNMCNASKGFPVRIRGSFGAVHTFLGGKLHVGLYPTGSYYHYHWGIPYNPNPNLIESHEEFLSLQPVFLFTPKRFDYAIFPLPDWVDALDAFRLFSKEKCSLCGI